MLDFSWLGTRAPTIFEDIDKFFSAISTWLKKIETICPDALSFGNAIKAAFENSKKLRSKTQDLEVFHVRVLVVFDYDTFYAPYI